MADSIILRTARLHDATPLSQFASMLGVCFFRKKILPQG
jgi:hypothetical protein